jgi:hypothetical protein
VGRWPHRLPARRAGTEHGPRGTQFVEPWSGGATGADRLPTLSWTGANRGCEPAATAATASHPKFALLAGSNLRILRSSGPSSATGGADVKSTCVSDFTSVSGDFICVLLASTERHRCATGHLLTTIKAPPRNRNSPPEDWAGCRAQALRAWPDATCCDGQCQGPQGAPPKGVTNVSSLDDAALHAHMVRARHQGFEPPFFCGGGSSGKVRTVRRSHGVTP